MIKSTENNAETESNKCGRINMVLIQVLKYNRLNCFSTRNGARVAHNEPDTDIFSHLLGDRCNKDILIDYHNLETEGRDTYCPKIINKI